MTTLAAHRTAVDLSMKMIEVIKRTDWSFSLLILGLVAIALPFVAGIVAALR